MTKNHQQMTINHQKRSANNYKPRQATKTTSKWPQTIPNDHRLPANDHKWPQTTSKWPQITINDCKSPANNHNKKKIFFLFRIPIILFFCKLETKWGLADLNKHYVTLYIHTFATHDILIYLVLIRVSLELETSYSRKLIYLLFVRFFIILCETVIIDFNVNKDLSVSRDITWDLASTSNLVPLLPRTIFLYCCSYVN